MDPVWKQVGVQKSLGLLLANAPEPIWIRCKSDRTGLLGTYIWSKQKRTSTTEKIDGVGEGEGEVVQYNTIQYNFIVSV